MKRVLPVILLLFLIYLLPVQTQAAGFDPVYYAQKYPDVVEALGDSRAALLNHYLTFGINEGRFQNAEEEAAGTPLSTYVDVNIEGQTVTYFQNGETMLSSPCVTGDVSKKRTTPTGIFAVSGHVKGTYLIGPTWKNWVDYWMPFYAGCGLHDATWRKNFGGEIYKTNGSHGCVNLPLEAAKKIYETVTIGYPVVCYK